jgi:hypothetical protein
MVCCGTLNLCSLIITSRLSAGSRVILDSVRSIIVWGFALALGWEQFCWVQVRDVSPEPASHPPTHTHTHTQPAHPCTPSAENYTQGILCALQVLGFAALVCGALVYHDIQLCAACQCFRASLRREGLSAQLLVNAEMTEAGEGA